MKSARFSGESRHTKTSARDPRRTIVVDFAFLGGTNHIIFQQVS